MSTDCLLLTRVSDRSRSHARWQGRSILAPLVLTAATINHHDTVSIDGKTTDGLVAVLTVRIKKRGIL